MLLNGIRSVNILTLANNNNERPEPNELPSDDSAVLSAIAEMIADSFAPMVKSPDAMFELFIL